MRAIAVAAAAFLIVAGILLSVAATGPQVQALVTAALFGVMTYVALITRSIADGMTVKKLRHEILKLQLEIEQLEKRKESRIQTPSTEEIVKLSLGHLFRGDPPSKW